jgi:hypothetical protein
VSIAVEPILFHVEPDVPATRAKVAQWCYQHLTSTVFEVSATKPMHWTIECGTLDVLCLLATDAEKVRSFFHDDVPF